MKREEPPLSLVSRDEVPLDRVRRRVFAIVGEAKLSDEDRRALASFVLGRHVGSFTELDRGDWLRVLDALLGWVAVRELRRQNGLER